MIFPNSNKNNEDLEYNARYYSNFPVIEKNSIFRYNKLNFAVYKYSESFERLKLFQELYPNSNKGKQFPLTPTEKKIADKINGRYNL